MKYANMIKKKKTKNEEIYIYIKKSVLYAILIIIRFCFNAKNISLVLYGPLFLRSRKTICMQIATSSPTPPLV